LARPRREHDWDRVDVREFRTSLRVRRGLPLRVIDPKWNPSRKGERAHAAREAMAYGLLTALGAGGDAV
jgi:hypothetical protein